MTDSSGARPQPQYGEYATPEEQRARIKEPPKWMLEAEAATASGAQGLTDDTVQRSVKVAQPAAAPAVGAAGTTPSRTVDRVVTIVLLIIGLYTVISVAVAAVAFPTFAAQWEEIMGTSTALTDVVSGPRAMGIAAIVLAAIWIATLVESVRRMRHRRLSWWIPAAAGIIANVVASIVMSAL